MSNYKALTAIAILCTVPYAHAVQPVGTRVGDPLGVFLSVDLPVALGGALPIGLGGVASIAAVALVLGVQLIRRRRK